MKHNYLWWVTELEYIRSICPHNPGSDFNNDSDCFASYCEMQSHSAEDDGLPEIADCIDSIGQKALAAS